MYIDVRTERVDRNLSDISFDSNSLKFWDKISMSGVTMGSNLFWDGPITSVAKAAESKLSIQDQKLFSHPINFEA